jgi:hypothetical protein
LPEVPSGMRRLMRGQMREPPTVHEAFRRNDCGQKTSDNEKPFPHREPARQVWSYRRPKPGIVIPAIPQINKQAHYRIVFGEPERLNRVNRLLTRLFARAAKPVAQDAYMIEGMPDEPGTGDWDAIGASPSIEEFFCTLFLDVTHKPLPDLTSNVEREEDETRVRTGWYGSQAFGAEVEVVQILESSTFAVRCRWETHGLPGMKLTWQYALDYAGQLGHVAYRHRRLVCRFDNEAVRNQFALVWQKAMGKTPVFAPVAKDS